MNILQFDLTGGDAFVQGDTCILGVQLIKREGYVDTLSGRPVIYEPVYFAAADYDGWQMRAQFRQGGVSGPLALDLAPAVWMAQAGWTDPAGLPLGDFNVAEIPASATASLDGGGRYDIKAISPQGRVGTVCEGAWGALVSSTIVDSPVPTGTPPPGGGASTGQPGTVRFLIARIVRPGRLVTAVAGGGGGVAPPPPAPASQSAPLDSVTRALPNGPTGATRANVTPRGADMTFITTNVPATTDVADQTVYLESPQEISTFRYSAVSGTGYIEILFLVA